MRSAAAANAVTRRQKADRVRRALASGAALAAVLGREDRALRQQAEAMDASDPRVAWLVAQAPRWRDAKEKTLVFVAHRETLEMLRTALSHGAQLATGVFHEDLPSSRRDLEVARFRDPGRPEPPGLDRMRRRGPQLRVLPAAGALRPAVEAGHRRTADRPARPHRPADPGRDRVLPAARRVGSRRRAPARGGGRLPRADRGPRPATGRYRGRRRGACDRSGGVAHRSRCRRAAGGGPGGAHAHRRRRLPAAAPRSRTGPRWPRASWRGCRATWTR